jgi:hypothetical protein
VRERTIDGRRALSSSSSIGAAAAGELQYIFRRVVSTTQN